MRILAFHFVDGAAADAALRRVHAEFDGAVRDIRTASVVVEEVEGVVLGTTVESNAQSRLVALVGAAGGRLVADVPEEWTDKPPSSAA